MDGRPIEAVYSEILAGPTGNRVIDSILDSEIKYLKGVGPRRGEVLRKTGVATFRDLLYYYPRRYLDRSSVTLIRDLTDDGGPVTIVGEVLAQGKARGRRPRFELRIDDGSGRQLRCVWFNGVAWISKAFQTGERLAVHGTPQRYGGGFSIVHPDFDRLDNEGPSLDTGRIIPLYPGGAALDRVGLTSRSFRKLIYTLIKKHGLEIPEVLPDETRHSYDLMDGNVAIRAVHFPKSHEELHRAQYRLKFEEFYFLQLLLAATRQGRREDAAGIRLTTEGPLLEAFPREVLPFELTDAQKRAVEEIGQDVAGGRQMNRLIQGDVGCGKTIVGVSAMLMAVDSGHQAAFMAPTEILAEQHYASLRRYLEPLGLNVGLLIGGQRKKLREEILTAIAAGEMQVVVGTHALIEEKVVFKSIGMAIVDEQHRFGVMQRARMFHKGARPHMLLMTATPIPRSLAMTLYGDLDVTVINELPAGRKPIETRLHSEKDRPEVYDFLRTQLRSGRQAYVVFPLVEESEKLDLKDAENGFKHLEEEFRAYTVDLVHGRMFSYEKDEAMARFKSGETDILVSTTVIEVGVDVSNATVMVIEHAERFGLSQLHQLRGRVGRGVEQSYCLLMADYRQSEEARERLQAMVSTTDGFKISEMDLKLRGAGDLLGTRQSGLPMFRLADLVHDQPILHKAREAAFALIEDDPHLRKERHAETRAHLERTAPEGTALARIG